MRSLALIPCLILPIALVACTKGESDEAQEIPGMAVLGNQSNNLERVNIDVIATSSDQLQHCTQRDRAGR